MKFFVFLIFAALIVGAIYHDAITDYVADLSSGGSYGSGGPSMFQSMQGVGSASSAAFGRVGKALGN